MEQFARDEHDIALLTAHHYITGQANPAATIETMLANNTKYDPVLARFQAAAQGAVKPWRMCETASFSGGGRQGVSDTFAAALWALDYLFVLAEHGCAGVNMETGVNHLGWISHYTPISDDLKGNYGKAPEYYGLQAFARMPKGDVLAVDCQGGGINLTAHAAHKGNELCVAVINKDLSQTANVVITTGGMTRATRVMRLHARSVTATADIVFAEASKGGAHVPKMDNAARIDVPAASAMLVWLSA